MKKLASKKNLKRINMEKVASMRIDLNFEKIKKEVKGGIILTFFDKCDDILEDEAIARAIISLSKRGRYKNIREAIYRRKERR